MGAKIPHRRARVMESRFIGKVAGVTGLEPAASGVTGRRSNQLSYTPNIIMVGDDGIEPPTLSV